MEFVLRLLKLKNATPLTSSGMSLIEVIIGVAIAGIAIAGGLEVISQIERTTANRAKQLSTSEEFGPEFYSAYESVSAEVMPISPASNKPYLALGWGVSTGGITANRNRVRDFCTLGIAPTKNSGTGLYRFQFQGGSLSDTPTDSTFGCPTNAQWTTYVNSLDENPNKSAPDNASTPILHFAVQGIGKLCKSNLVSTTPYTWEVENNSCLEDTNPTPANRFDHLSASSKVALPVFTAFSFADVNDRDFASVGAIFHSVSRTTEGLASQCSLKSNLRRSDFVLDVNPAVSNETEEFASVTLSTSFKDDQDVIALLSGVGNFDASFNTLSFDGTNICNTGTRQYGVSQNQSGDKVHKYCNIPISVDGTTKTIHARYNQSQGYMKIRAPGGATMDEWSSIFDDIVYINLFESDNDPATIPTTVDREVIFSMGDLPSRVQDGDLHYYDFMECSPPSVTTKDTTQFYCVSWWQAYEGAQAQSHLGLTGYLPTITSQNENDFISSRMRVGSGNTETFAAGWLGGLDNIDRQICHGSGADNARCDKPLNVAGTSPPVKVLCPSLSSNRGEDKWYWVTGKSNEVCRQFWDGKLGDGQPIKRDGTITQDANPNGSNYVNPVATNDWNCDFNLSDNAGTSRDERAMIFIPEYSSDPNDGDAYYFGETNTNLKFAHMAEIVWGTGSISVANGGCGGLRDNSANCSGETFTGKTDEYWFANWASGGWNSRSCTMNGTPSEPTGDGNKGDALQMTGLPSGKGFWNDLVGNAQHQKVHARSWYNIKGYFVEFDNSNAPSNQVLARNETVNVARVMALCEEGAGGLGFDASWGD